MDSLIGQKVTVTLDKNHFKDNKHVIGVRFYQNNGFSLKRYCYFTDVELTPGDHVVVNVCGEEKVVKVVATSNSFWPGEPSSLTSVELARSVKWIVRVATRTERMEMKRRFKI